MMVCTYRQCLPEIAASAYGLLAMTNLGHCTARWKALFQIQMAAQDALRDEEIHNAEDGQ